ncbi:NAD-dependent protein deacetylase Sirt6-like isoform X2 [Paramacrobiotus metropolitanus]|uniref:NAD-dependent protein deacetylase Sirt6-like isoform X2 n=1 Tax=Paramacrobiotus metropolitanus TaxID=2943436 RepID=UPI00244643EE|nr:NAD-dependent protein deacetylase Sirt6-like isoform X2 [Paramacrobiotus metropolitanus]
MCQWHGCSGPNGVWTAEKKKRRPPPSKSFTEVIPTVSHMALRKLVDVGIVKFIISQNVDGLHLRSGIPPSYVAELHGNVFRETCRKCRRMYMRNCPTPTLGMKPTGGICDGVSKRTCRGALVDMVLDWRNKLPEDDLAAAEAHSSAADLNLVLGSTLQIVPAGELPFRRQEIDSTAKTAICNLQTTKFDDKMDLVIRCKLDAMFLRLMALLNIEIPAYDAKLDPVLTLSSDEYRTHFSRIFQQVPMNTDADNLIVVNEKCIDEKPEESDVHNCSVKRLKTE